MASKRGKSYVKNVDPVRRMLKRLPKDCQLEVRTVIADMAQKIERSAKQRVPVDTGTLAKLLMHKLSSDRMQAKIGFIGKRLFRKTFYAKFVEFGTRGYKTGEIRRTKNSSTTKHIKRGVPARPAQPFLRPAVLEHATEFNKRMAAAVKKAVEKAKTRAR